MQHVKVHLKMWNVWTACYNGISFLMKISFNWVSPVCYCFTALFSNKKYIVICSSQFLFAVDFLFTLMKPFYPAPTSTWASHSLSYYLWHWEWTGTGNAVLQLNLVSTQDPKTEKQNSSAKYGIGFEFLVIRLDVMQLYPFCCQFGNMCSYICMCPNFIRNNWHFVDNRIIPLPLPILNSAFNSTLTRVWGG